MKSEEHLLKEEKSKDNELKFMRLKSHGSALQWQNKALQHNRHVNWKFEKACSKNGKDLEGIRLGIFGLSKKSLIIKEMVII